MLHCTLAHRSRYNWLVPCTYMQLSCSSQHGVQPARSLPVNCSSLYYNNLSGELRCSWPSACFALLSSNLRESAACRKQTRCVTPSALQAPCPRSGAARRALSLPWPNCELPPHACTTCMLHMPFCCFALPACALSQAAQAPRHTLTLFLLCSELTNNRIQGGRERGAVCWSLAQTISSLRVPAPLLPHTPSCARGSCRHFAAGLGRDRVPCADILGAWSQQFGRQVSPSASKGWQHRWLVDSGRRAGLCNAA